MDAEQNNINGSDTTVSYFFSVPGGNGCDTAFIHSTAAETITVPSTVAVDDVRPVSPLHDTGIVSLLLIVFLLVAFNFKNGYKYFLHLDNYLFSVRRYQNTFDDHTVSETGLMFSLIANTCVMEGIIIYLALGYYGSLPPEAGLVTKLIGGLSGGALLFYLAQQVLYRVLGYTFLADAVGTRLLVEGFNASQAILGLLLCPVAFAMLLWPGSFVMLFMLAALMYIICRIVFICKGFRIFFNNLASLLYFILYLCSVEIVPLVLSFAGVSFLCEILQS